MNVASVTIGCFQKTIETPKNQFDAELVAALKSKLMLAHRGLVSLMLRDDKGKRLDHEYHIV